MKFKSLLLIILLINVVTQIQASNSKPNFVTYLDAKGDLKEKFNTDISKYLNAFNEGDWDGVIKMIYPKLFDFMTKEQMIASFNQLEEMGIDMKTDFNKVEKISEVINFEDSKYCRVYYNGKLNIKIKGQMLESIDLLEQNFNEAYGEKNVTYDKKINSLILMLKNQCLQ